MYSTHNIMNNPNVNRMEETNHANAKPVVNTKHLLIDQLSSMTLLCEVLGVNDLLAG